MCGCVSYAEVPPLIMQFTFAGALMTFFLVGVGGLVGAVIAKKKGHRALTWTLYMVALMPFIFVATVLHINQPHYVDLCCEEDYGRNTHESLPHQRRA